MGLARQRVGRVVQVIGLEAAPDYETNARQAGLMDRYADDMAGRSGTVYGDDRGSALTGHAFAGPVRLVSNVTGAINGTRTASGLYKTQLEVQDSLSANPDLDPYARLLLARNKNG